MQVGIELPGVQQVRISSVYCSTVVENRAESYDPFIRAIKPVGPDIGSDAVWTPELPLFGLCKARFCPVESEEYKVLLELWPAAIFNND